MTGIVEEAEASIDYWRHFQKQRVVPASNINDAITHTCCLTAKDLDAKAILAATNSRPYRPDDLSVPPLLPRGRPDHA